MPAASRQQQQQQKQAGLLPAIAQDQQAAGADAAAPANFKQRQQQRQAGLLSAAAGPDAVAPPNFKQQQKLKNAALITADLAALAAAVLADIPAELLTSAEQQQTALKQQQQQTALKQQQQQVAGFAGNSADTVALAAAVQVEAGNVTDSPNAAAAAAAAAAVAAGHGAAAIEVEAGSTEHDPAAAAAAGHGDVGDGTAAAVEGAAEAITAAEVAAAGTSKVAAAAATPGAAEAAGTADALEVPVAALHQQPAQGMPAASRAVTAAAAAAANSPVGVLTTSTSSSPVGSSMAVGSNKAGSVAAAAPAAAVAVAACAAGVDNSPVQPLEHAVPTAAAEGAPAADVVLVPSMLQGSMQQQQLTPDPSPFATPNQAQLKASMAAVGDLVQQLCHSSTPAPGSSPGASPAAAAAAFVPADAAAASNSAGARRALGQQLRQQQQPNWLRRAAAAANAVAAAAEAAALQSQPAAIGYNGLVTAGVPGQQNLSSNLEQLASPASSAKQQALLSVQLLANRRSPSSSGQQQAPGTGQAAAAVTTRQLDAMGLADSDQLKAEEGAAEQGSGRATAPADAMPACAAAAEDAAAAAVAVKQGAAATTTAAATEDAASIQLVVVQESAQLPDRADWSHMAVMCPGVAKGQAAAATVGQAAAATVGQAAAATVGQAAAATVGQAAAATVGQAVTAAAGQAATAVPGVQAEMLDMLQLQDTAANQDDALQLGRVSGAVAAGEAPSVPAVEEAAVVAVEQHVENKAAMVEVEEDAAGQLRAFEELQSPQQQQQQQGTKVLSQHARQVILADLAGWFAEGQQQQRQQQLNAMAAAVRPQCQSGSSSSRKRGRAGWDEEDVALGEVELQDGASMQTEQQQQQRQQQCEVGQGVCHEAAAVSEDASTRLTAGCLQPTSKRVRLAADEEGNASLGSLPALAAAVPQGAVGCVACAAETGTPAAAVLPGFLLALEFLGVRAA
jgi:hypothetical protein